MDYLNPIFDSVGVNYEELNDKSFYLKPSDNMLVPAYPGLENEGRSFTTDREYALYRDDLGFLSWEHPITINTIELFTGSQLGNNTLVTHDGQLPGPLLFELIFKLEAISKLGEVATDYLPITPIRVLIDSQGQDITSKYPKKHIDSLVQDMQDSSSLSNLPKEAVKELFRKASGIAHKRAQRYIDEAINTLNEDSAIEINNLTHLEKVNPLVDHSEIQTAKSIHKAAVETISHAKVQLDAIRVILRTS